MGHFSHCCKVSGLPITSDTYAVLIVIKLNDDLYNNSEKSIRKFGTTYMCSNNGVRLKFKPVWYPLFGCYDGYGGLIDIVEDDNTKALEEFYGLPIQDIVDVITSNRKDDKFDDNLDIICDKRGNYKQRYKELLTYSGMWVHGDFYKKVNENKLNDNYHISFGKPEFLNYIGFKEINEIKRDFSSIDKITDYFNKLREKEKDRYHRIFEKDGFQLKSDGNYLEKSIFNYKELIEECLKHNAQINVESLENQTYCGQFYDLILRNYKYKKDIFHTDIEVLYYILDSDKYSNKRNKISKTYLKYINEGKLKQNIVDLFYFENIMFSLGRFYDVVGTSPQDGEHKMVYQSLKIAKEIIKTKIKEYEREN